EAYAGLDNLTLQGYLIIILAVSTKHIPAVFGQAIVQGYIAGNIGSLFILAGISQDAEVISYCYFKSVIEYSLAEIHIKVSPFVTAAAGMIFSRFQVEVKLYTSHQSGCHVVMLFREYSADTLFSQC